MVLDAKMIKTYAYQNDIDAIGIAKAKHFTDAPNGCKPEDLLPNARSVIVCAKALPASTLNGLGTVYHRVVASMSHQLDSFSIKMSRFIEKHGYMALPMPADDPYYYWEEENKYGRGDFSHRHAAQAAGLGKIGKSSLLISPQYGTMFRLVSIITSLEVESDEVSDWQPCADSCSLCANACPVKALNLHGDRVTTQHLCRQNVMEKTPKGKWIETCRECQKACPWTSKYLKQISVSKEA